MSKEYGKQITPILEEISDSLWEIDAREHQEPYGYGSSALNSASKIMMSVCMDRMWSDFEKLDTRLEARLNIVEAFGNDFRQLIKTHLGVDMHEEIRRVRDESE